MRSTRTSDVPPEAGGVLVTFELKRTTARAVRIETVRKVCAEGVVVAVTSSASGVSWSFGRPAG